MYGGIIFTTTNKTCPLSSETSEELLDQWLPGFIYLLSFDEVNMRLICFQSTDIHRATPSNISFVKFI